MSNLEPFTLKIADLIACVGYTQERLHSGLLKLVGQAPTPIRQAFFAALDLPDPSNGGTCSWNFEMHKIDLVITTANGKKWGVEFKIDGSPTRNQLLGYVGHVDRLLFVTLGMAEDMATFPLPDKTSHIGLERWCRAVAQARQIAPAGLMEILAGYELSYMQEISHRERVNPYNLNSPRHAFGRIQLLGWLARELQPTLMSLGLDHEVKTCGVQGDVTFTVWEPTNEDSFYLEINTSGKLALKASEAVSNNDALLRSAMTACRTLLPFTPTYDGQWKQRQEAKTKTMTLGVWDIGPLWTRLHSRDARAVTDLRDRLSRFHSHIVPLLRGDLT